MKKTAFTAKIIVLFFSICMITSGCDMLKEEAIPENLPPVPVACMKESNLYANALYGLSNPLANVSQLQVSRMAGKFAACLENEGLTPAEARGIVKKQKEEFNASQGN
ncbi:MAG TPA: hypothetical protein ENG95_05805 [Nitrospirae bacterium]|nr:hypothetical protein BMS3Abin10_00198 [bacterium BMS3Abin10]GBE39830.1 hypothetical protein BMS3Bbin08_02462 [bacterium BMS3Bbin08]HDH51193.1 hypothetical protein [Nitrospirota bacterium]HDK81834.1 hypothetical protein [Nitrospirota bacterium]HDO26136.1 hypothetical protein [Nitrospirota bacterium]